MREKNAVLPWIKNKTHYLYLWEKINGTAIFC